MARFLHRAKQVLGNAYFPRPFSGLFLASASSTAAGHLGLARASATPALRDLLTPGAFLLDATNVLGAVALRGLPRTGELKRYIRDSCARARAGAEAQGDAECPEVLRLTRALFDAEDGRCKDALDDLAHLAAESPDCCPTHLFAAGVCDMLGRVDEADRWLAGTLAEQYLRECITYYNLALVAAAVGGAPGAVAGARGRVVSAAFQIINESVSDGKMSAFETIITGLLLKHAVKRRCKDLPPNHGDYGILRALADAFSLSGSVPNGRRTFFVLQASQALLSAVVLGAPPLSGERVVERDLACAVEEGDAAAVCDLRLLLAFLDARDGRFDDALARYEEVARDDPSDPRPHFLALAVCVFAMRPVEEYEQWEASYSRLCLAPGLSLRDRVALGTLMEELLVALALASPSFKVCSMDIIVRAAGNRVDAALVSALRSKNLSVVEWMEVRAARAFLYAGMWSSLKKNECEHGGSGTTTVD